MSAILTVDGVSHRFGSVQALREVSFDVQAGEVTGLLGPNGAGKTTLLQLMLGLLVPTAGELRICGKNARQQAQVGGDAVASVGDGHEPLGQATLGLLEALQASAMPGFDRRAFRDWCRARELGPEQRFGRLSKGQRRWVLCGLALAARPRLVLLDEPADGLDPAARRALYDALRAHATRHEMAILITTHLLHDIERVADRVVILDRGRVRLAAALEDLREQVREVEWSGAAPVEGASGATVLAREQVGTTQRLWLRSEEGVVEGRTVGLEELYLALTRHGQEEEP